MTISLTILAQTTIDAANEDDYEQQRDKIVSKFEDQGWQVSIESEEDEEIENE